MSSVDPREQSNEDEPVHFGHTGSRRGRSLSTGPLALGLLSATSPAAATGQAPQQTREFELVWRAPKSCPQHPAVISAFIAKRHPDLPALPHASRGEIKAEGTGYLLRLQWQGVWGLEQRETYSEDCQLLGQLAALTLAVQARELQVSQREAAKARGASPWSAAASVRTASPPEPFPTSSAIPRPPQTPAVARPRPEPSAQPMTNKAAPIDERPPGPEPEATRSPRPTRLSLGLTALGSVGVLPRASIRPQIDFSVHGRMWEIQFALAYAPPNSFELSEDDRRAELDLWHARFSLCARPDSGRLSLPNCLGLDAGAMSLRRSEAQNPRPNLPPQLWLAVEITSGLRWRIHPHLSLELSAAMLANLVRPAYTTVQHQPKAIYVVPVLGGRASLGLRVHLPTNGGSRGRSAAGRIGPG